MRTWTIGNETYRGQGRSQFPGVRALSAVCIGLFALTADAGAPFVAGREGLPNQFSIGRLDSPSAVGPRLDDNQREPDYSASREPELTEWERGLLEAAGAEQDIKLYMDSHPGVVGVLRLALGSGSLRDFEGRYTGLYVATVVIRKDQTSMEFVSSTPEAYLPSTVGSGEILRRIRDRHQTWRRDFGEDITDWVAAELNAVDVLSMRTCSPMRRRTPRTWLPVCHADFTQPVFNYATYRARVFFGAKRESGTVDWNAFCIEEPCEIADVRYERLLYVLRWCEPACDILKTAQQCSVLPMAWWRGLPVFGAEGELCLPRVQGAPRRTPVERQAEPPPSGEALLWLRPRSLLMGAFLGVLLWTLVYALVLVFVRRRRRVDPPAA